MQILEIPVVAWDDRLGRPGMRDVFANFLGAALVRVGGRFVGARYVPRDDDPVLRERRVDRRACGYYRATVLLPADFDLLALAERLAPVLGLAGLSVPPRWDLIRHLVRSGVVVKDGEWRIGPPGPAGMGMLPCMVEGWGGPPGGDVSRRAPPG